MRDIALGDLEHELDSARLLLERIPDRMSWRPHERSMTIGALGWHIANLLFWQTSIARDPEYDVAASPPPRADDPSDRQELLDHFDRCRSELREQMEKLDEAALSETWTLRAGSRVISRMSRAAALRTMGISHMIHHRGQLTVYLRLLDVPLPGIYGPSADEQLAQKS